MKTYTTAQGDMWDLIAYNEMGSASYTYLLIRNNIRYCRLFDFPAGVVLTIPDVPENSIPDSLPPWKR